MIATATPDDLRRECLQRLVLVLVHVRREKRKASKLRAKEGNADARLDSAIALATVRFKRECRAALERWARAKGIA